MILVKLYDEKGNEVGSAEGNQVIVTVVNKETQKFSVLTAGIYKDNKIKKINPVALFLWWTDLLPKYIFHNPNDYPDFLKKEMSEVFLPGLRFLSDQLIKYAKAKKEVPPMDEIYRRTMNFFSKN